MTEQTCAEQMRAAAKDTRSAPTSMHSRPGAAQRPAPRGAPGPAPRTRSAAPASVAPAAAVRLELCSKTLVAGARRAQDRLRIIFVELQMLCDQEHPRLSYPRNGFCIPTPPALDNSTRIFLGAL